MATGWKKIATDRAAGSNPPYFKFPIVVPRGPFKITIDVKPGALRLKRSGIGCDYISKDGVWSKDEAWRKVYRRLVSGKLYRMDFYFVDQYVFVFFDGKLFSLQRDLRAYCSAQIGLFINGMIINRIEIQDWPLAKAPKEIQDPDACYVNILQSPHWMQLKAAWGYPKKLKASIQAGAKRNIDFRNKIRKQKGRATSSTWDFKDGACQALKVIEGN